MVQEHSQRVDVGLNARRPASPQLGSQVQWSSRQQSRRGVHRGVPGILTGAEVHQHDATGRLAHDVLGLDVAVQQPDGVRRRERATEVDSDRDRFGRRERSALVQSHRERLAVNELGPDAALPVDSLGAVDGDHVGMPDAGEQAALLDRPARLIRGFVLAPMKQFQRDLAIEAGVPRTIDLAKSAGSDALEQRQRAPGAER